MDNMDIIQGDANLDKKLEQLIIGDADLEKKLEQLQKQLSKKQQFEESVSSIKSLLQQSYSNASPTVQTLVG